MPSTFSSTQNSCLAGTTCSRGGRARWTFSATTSPLSLSTWGCIGVLLQWTSRSPQFTIMTAWEGTTWHVWTHFASTWRRSMRTRRRSLTAQIYFLRYCVGSTALGYWLIVLDHFVFQTGDCKKHTPAEQQLRLRHVWLQVFGVPVTKSQQHLCIGQLALLQK
jgi:hypothetical protein